MRSERHLRRLASLVTAVLVAGAFWLARAPGVVASASISYVQGVSFTAGARALSTQVNLVNQVDAGALLVGWFAQYNAAGVVGVSDTVNGAWTRGPASEAFGGGGGDIALYYVENSQAAPNGISIEVTAPGPAYLQGAVGEYTGVAGTGALDRAAFSHGTGTAVDTGPTSPVAAGELVFSGLLTGGSPGSETPGDSQGVIYTQRSSVAGGAAAAEDIAFSTAGPQSGRATLAAATDWYAVVATFRPASAGPTTGLHYAADGAFNGNVYEPGNYGFNLADVSSPWWAAHLPAGIKALVYLGSCTGADPAFVSTVTPFLGNASVYGYYLADQPDPTGRYKTLCPAANLKAESDWIHANDPGKVTFVTLMNLGATRSPSYVGNYNPANTGIDLYGIDPYPCRTELAGCDDTFITKGVAAAVAAGIPQADLVPVYQTFGGGSWTDDGGGAYQLPTADQERQLLDTWASVLPSPAFDYAYSWGSQNGDSSLATSPSLLGVMRAHNQPG